MPTRTRIVQLIRVTCLRGETLFFKYEGGGSRRGNSRYGFIYPEHAPEFDGMNGWFEIERVHGKPWGYDRVVRRVEPPPGRT